MGKGQLEGFLFFIFIIIGLWKKKKKNAYAKAENKDKGIKDRLSKVFTRRISSVKKKRKGHLMLAQVVG